MNERNNQLTDEYMKHKIFTEISDYSDFYASLEFSIFQWVTFGIEALNIDTYILSSMKGTLESIRIILNAGKINDAFSLTRKYYDNVVINIYSLLYLEDNHSLDNLIVDEINDWVKGRKKLPDYRIMNSYIRNSKKLNSINKLIFIGDYYTKMRQRLNDHTHYNFFKYMIYNNDQIAIRGNSRIKLLDQLSIDIKNIFILHFIWLFTLKDNYMMASDYIDYKDLGLEPPEGTQYFVAPFIQKVFDELIKVERPDLVDEFVNSTSMRLS